MTLSITRAGASNSLPGPLHTAPARSGRALLDQPATPGSGGAARPPVAASSVQLNRVPPSRGPQQSATATESPEPPRFERIRALDPQQSFGATLYAAAERGDSGEYRGRRLDLRI